MMSSQNRRILVNFKTKKEPRKSKESQKENKTEYDPSKSQLKFLTDVTSDILNRGIFSERGLRSAINSQVRLYKLLVLSSSLLTVQAKKTDYEMSSLEIENLLRQLKLELGIESNTLGETARNSKGKSEKTFLANLLTTKERNPALPPAPPHRKTLQEIKESDKKKQDDQKILDDLSEREIKELLKDASLGSFIDRVDI